MKFTINNKQFTVSWKHNRNRNNSEPVEVTGQDSTLCYITVDNGDGTSSGVSATAWVSPKDHFCRKTGMKISFRKAVSGFNDKVLRTKLWEEFFKRVSGTLYYKGKPYKKVTNSMIKIDDRWAPVIIYNCLYNNPDGKTWVRFKNDFETKFKSEPNDSDSITDR